MERLKGTKDLLRIIRQISSGNYGGEILEMTGPEVAPEIQELAEAVGVMMVKIEAREARLEQLLTKMKRDSVNTVMAVVHALGARDSYTEGHGERVGVYARQLAQCLELSPAQVEQVRIAGTLHDIGKIGFSDSMFDDDMPLSEEMVYEIRNHPRWGRDILKDLDFLGPSLDFVYHHHEHVDGNGYPDGLAGEAIPLGARIISVVDHFDAMTTDRSYKQRVTDEEAFEQLRHLSGSSLDGKLVEVFIDSVINGAISLPKAK